MVRKVRKPSSGLPYVFISLILSISLPLLYAGYFIINATQNFATDFVSGEYNTIEEYVLSSLSQGNTVLIVQGLLWVGMLSGPILAAIMKIKLWLDDTKVLSLGYKNKWLWMGPLLGLAAQSVLLVFGFLVQQAFPEGEVEGNAGEIIDSFSGIPIFAIILMIVVGAPIVEEILYRGLVFTALSNKIGVLAGAIISSLAFGLSHVSALTINGIFTAAITSLFGGLLVYARIKSKGLFLPILMHMSFNGISAIAIVVALENGII